MPQWDDTDPAPVREAREHLRMIRELMERSTRYSTFSGLSGVFAGLVSIAGCLVQGLYILTLPPERRELPFLVNWGLVALLAIGIDFLLTKRRALAVGKRIRSRLGKQMAMAAAPGLGLGALLTLFFLQHGLMDQVYPFWMLSYGCAVCAVGLFSQRSVSRLGAAFVAAGAATILIEALISFPPGMLGLVMMGISAGGFHIIYGIAVSRRDGW